MDDIDQLLSFMEDTGSITDVIIDDNRRRHVTVLLSERGTWNAELSATESKNQRHKMEGTYRGRLLKRTIKRSKSVMDMFLPSSDAKDFDIYKAKNIKQVITFLECSFVGSTSTLNRKSTKFLCTN